MRFLKVNWGEQRFEELNCTLVELAVDQVLLEAIDNAEVDVVKVETLRGEPAFRRALVQKNEAEGEEEEDEFEISDWELIT